MANEFYYTVSLSILHPSIDPQVITDTIPNLRPRIQTKAGSERRGKDGSLLVPIRRAMFSHWLADLHESERLYSAEIAISDFILSKLRDLDPFQSFFAELRKQGEVVLRIGWYNDTNHSAGVLRTELLNKCGKLAIDIELNYYYTP